MVRAQLLNCNGIAPPKACSEDQVVEQLIEALYKLRDKRTDSLASLMSRNRRARWSVATASER
jgi:hypothetical protein